MKGKSGERREEGGGNGWNHRPWATRIHPTVERVCGPGTHIPVDISVSRISMDRGSDRYCNERNLSKAFSIAIRGRYIRSETRRRITKTTSTNVRVIEISKASQLRDVYSRLNCIWFLFQLRFSNQSVFVHACYLPLESYNECQAVRCCRFSQEK